MPVLSSKDRRRVGADRVERAVAQRNLAVEAGQDIEPQHGDGVDQHLAELGYAIATDRKRQDAGDRQDRGNRRIATLPATARHTPRALPMVSRWESSSSYSRDQGSTEETGGFENQDADKKAADGCMRDAGFKETRVELPCGPDSMVVGIK
jgi:hypothetical protein